MQQKSILKNSSAKKLRPIASRSTSRSKSRSKSRKSLSARRVAKKIAALLKEQKQRLLSQESEDSDSDEEFQYAKKIGIMAKRDHNMPKWQ